MFGPANAYHMADNERSFKFANTDICTWLFLYRCMRVCLWCVCVCVCVLAVCVTVCVCVCIA